MYRRNIARLVSAIVLLAYGGWSLWTAGRQAGGGSVWSLTHRATVVPALLLGAYMLAAGVQNLIRVPYRLGGRAVSQLEGPCLERYAVPMAAAFAFYGIASKSSVTKWNGMLLCGAVLLSAYLGLCYANRVMRWKRELDGLRGHTLCANCGYILSGITTDRCPECGAHLNARPRRVTYGLEISVR